MLRLNRICSDNNNFDKRCNELESWLFEKGYSEKMVRKQVLRAREHSRESPLKKVKSESNQRKLTFNITYYPVFQNVRNILQEFHILLTPDQEHKKVFQDIPVEIAGRSESCGKGNCQVFDYICDTDAFTTKACGETFKIQSGILNCNSQKVVYLLKCRICGEAPYVGKAKTKFRARFNNYKSAHRSYRKKRKVSQQRFHEHYGQHSHNGIDDWQFTLIEQCETHEQLKERETFWQHRLKTFYPYGLNEKKEYLY